jgi:hypothetical protein
MAQTTFDARQINDGAAWPTVAEAAEQIGVSERSLRRFLRAPEHRQQTEAGTRRERRQTNTGARDATVLSPSFIESLKAHFSDQNSAQSTAERNTGTQDRHNTGENAGTTQANTGAPPLPTGDRSDAAGMITPANDMRLAIVYERLITAKNEQIESLTARIESLESALQREQENTARAQALHAMLPPQATKVPQTEQSTADAPTVAATSPPADRDKKKPRQYTSRSFRSWLLRVLRG